MLQIQATQPLPSKEEGRHEGYKEALEIILYCSLSQNKGYKILADRGNIAVRQE